VFVFCLTVYTDIFVIVLEIKREGGDARREKRTGRFRRILDAIYIYTYTLYIQHNHENRFNESNVFIVR